MGILVLFPNNIKRIILLFLTFISIGCQEDRVIILPDPNFTMSQGLIFYEGKAFTGKVKEENLAMQEEYITSYKNGAEDGEYIAKKKSGQLLEKRFYKDGAKHGIHRSWFANGNNRLFSEFNEGKYINDRWEWHDNNTPYIYEKFDKNGKILISKVWRRNGKIYMNNTFTKTGESLGLPGSKNCDPISSLNKGVKE